MRRTGKDIFAILVRENEWALLAFVRSCVYDPAAADDIVQETFLAAWHRISDYDRDRPVIAWLRGIAQNKILEYFRRSRTSRQHLSFFTPELLSKIAEQQDRLTAASGDTFVERLAPLRECLEELKAQDRGLVEAHYHDGKTCTVIAAAAGYTVEAIKKRLQRTRAALKDCILGKLKVVSSDG